MSQGRVDRRLTGGACSVGPSWTAQPPAPRVPLPLGGGPPCPEDSRWRSAFRGRTCWHAPACGDGLEISAVFPLHVIISVTVVIKPTPGGASRAYSWGHSACGNWKCHGLRGDPPGWAVGTLGALSQRPPASSAGCSGLQQAVYSDGSSFPRIVTSPPPQILGSRMRVGAC